VAQKRIVKVPNQEVTKAAETDFFLLMAGLVQNCVGFLQWFSQFSKHPPM